MTPWARLTWQSPDPAELAADLARRLGVTPAAHPTLPGAFVVDLGPAHLELVPWRRESPSDKPQRGGRLVFEPIEVGTEDRVPLAAPAFGSAVPGPILAGVGWATVELDRAEDELGDWLVREPTRADLAHAEPDLADPHLGARARVRYTLGLPGRRLVLLEPTTEGRVAASLARDGEGPCALYLEPAAGLEAWVSETRARGVTVSVQGDGPLGPSVLVGGDPVAGPHLVVTGRLSSAARPPAGTIAA